MCVRVYRKAEFVIECTDEEGEMNLSCRVRIRTRLHRLRTYLICAIASKTLRILA